METSIESLQTAIRRYCIDNHSKWTNEYSKLVSEGTNRIGYGYSDEALNIFPRYILLNSILEEVERYRSDEFATLEDAKRFFKLLVSQTPSGEKGSTQSEIEIAAIEQERRNLSSFVEGLNAADLRSVEPLFYRRVMSDEEVDLIRGKLNQHWNVCRGYWFPLTIDRPENVEAFQDSYFEKEISEGKLRRLLDARGVVKIYEIREHGANYELELSTFEPYYNGAEGFWCDDNYDWVIYASHESSITVGGWLLSEVKQNWPNWKERVWTTPFFD